MALNDGYAYREQVTARGAGQTLLHYLSDRWRHSTPGEWADRLARGEVQLDGVTAGAEVVLRAGQRVTWHRPPWAEPDVPGHYEVLYQDETILAVAKPSGLPTMPAGGFLTHTLATLVRAKHPEARLMHRLGRHTSGIVLFARTSEAASILAAAWRRHEVQKRYRALAAGVATQDEYTIDAPIGPVAHPLIGCVHAASPLGKPSHTHATVRERRQTSTLFQVDITTGRPHQIRIHLASVGHPLVGDALYDVGGAPRVNTTTLPGDGGYLLHAERLRFVHPLSRAAMEISSTPPLALQSTNERD
jgi:23S rRNA pseudouridine1911/1915/1917 synthase